MIDKLVAPYHWVLGLTFCFVLATSVLAPNAFAQTQDPEAFIQELGDKTVAVLDDPDLDSDQRIAQISALVDEGTDLDYLARSVLGKHWRTASAQEKEDFTAAFRSYTLNWIADKMNKYEARGFEITGSRQANERDTVVATNILLEGEADPVRVQWAVRETDGRLLILNIIIDTYNLLVTERSVIGDMVSQKGMDGVTALLNERANGTGAG